MNKETVDSDFYDYGILYRQPFKDTVSDTEDLNDLSENVNNHKDG